MKRRFVTYMGRVGFTIGRVARPFFIHTSI